jgi:nucleotide-binding universal stress UspA family protein
MDMAGRPLKIVWAVDPFTRVGAPKHYDRILAAIRSSVGDRPAEIQPLHLFHARPLPAIPTSRAGTGKRRRMDEAAQAAFDARIAPNGRAALKRLRIIPCDGLSAHADTKRLLRWAKRWRADLIVAGMSSHGSASNLVFGSFAEELALESDIPLLLIPPRWKERYTQKNPIFRHILFPTDFSEASRKAFRNVVELARAHGSSLTIFYKTYFSWPSSVDLPREVLTVYRRAFKSELSAARKTAEGWLREARKAGISASLAIDHHPDARITDSIFSRSRNKPGIIAMATQSGPFRAALQGSVARKVLRSATCPVWLLHPHAPSGRAKRARELPLYSISTDEVLTDLHRHAGAFR